MDTHFRCWMPDLPYAASATSHEGHVDFTVYGPAAIVSVDGGAPRVGYERADTMSHWTHDPTQARVVLKGSVKWDGCSNWDHRTNDVLAHYCGEEDAAAVGTLFRRLYEWARELGQDRHHDGRAHVAHVRTRPDTDSLVAYLNSLVQVDREAMQALMDLRVPCNGRMGKHPTVQVHMLFGQDQPQFLVGLLGIVNGYCGVFPPGHAFAGYGLISAIYDGAGQLMGFNRTDRPGPMLPALTTPGAVVRQR